MSAKLTDVASLKKIVNDGEYICAIRLTASSSSCIAGKHIKTRSEKTILIRSFEKLEESEDSELDVYLSSRVDDEWHEIKARVISCYEMPHKEFFITFGDVNSQDKCSREVEQAIAALQALAIQEESNESAKV